MQAGSRSTYPRNDFAAPFLWTGASSAKGSDSHPRQTRRAILRPRTGSPTRLSRPIILQSYAFTGPSLVAPACRVVSSATPQAVLQAPASGTGESPGREKRPRRPYIRFSGPLTETPLAPDCPLSLNLSRTCETSPYREDWVAEGARFELADPCGSPVFKTGALNQTRPPLHVHPTMFTPLLAEADLLPFRGLRPRLKSRKGTSSRSSGDELLASHVGLQYLRDVHRAVGALVGLEH